MLLLGCPPGRRAIEKVQQIPVGLAACGSFL